MVAMFGFWSYVHADDKIDFGRVADLARDIVGNYEAVRAEDIKLFLDRDDLTWGDEWRDKIDTTLANVAFFIPVITPRFFKSRECRREFRFFLDRATSLGIPQLILPILYIDVPELHEDSPEDTLVAAVKRIQYENWTELRMKERQSEAYRTAVNALALKLVDRVSSVEATDIVAVIESTEQEDTDAPGIIDRVAALEEAMPHWSEALDEIAASISEIGEVMRLGGEEIRRGDTQGKGFAARLAVARRVARDLNEPVERIEQGARDFVEGLSTIDSGVRAIIEVARDQPLADEDERASAQEFMAMIAGLSQAANEGLGAAAGLLEAVGQVERTSRDMRPPMRRLRDSLTSLYEAREITGAWLTLVRDSGFQEKAAPEGPPLT